MAGFPCLLSITHHAVKDTYTKMGQNGGFVKSLTVVGGRGVRADRGAVKS